MTRVVLIDADTLVYEAARANEFDVQWSPDLWTTQGHLEPAIAHFDDAVATIKSKLSADKVVLALSNYESPWRRQVMPEYKAQRVESKKPILFKALREYCSEAYETHEFPTCEGDDVLGILLTEPQAAEERICVSIDKDMQTLPGWHVNLNHARKNDDWRVRTIDLHDANYFHLKQALMGDTTDGYSGCPKVGPVGAEKLLEPFWFGDGGPEYDTVGAWAAIVERYAKAGLSEEVALQNARVARICRWTDYDHDKREVILWNPN